MKTKNIILLFLLFLFCAAGFAQEADKINYQPHAFGIETSPGIGVRDKNYFDEPGAFGLSFDMGLRYTRNFSPYIGWDAVKLKVFLINPLPFDGNEAFFQMGCELLTGIRASTQRFGSKKTSYYYGAFRLGGAYYFDTFEIYDPENREHETEYLALKFGFTCELEYGIHFKRIFIGPKYSFLNMRHYFGFNIGVDIGKYVETNR